MRELNNISGQQFYYATIDDILGRWSQKEKCALIIDKSFLNNLLEDGENIIEESGQIIIISENVDAALPKLEGVNVLLIAANDIREAAKIAILGAALATKVICILKEDEKAVSNILDGLGT